MELSETQSKILSALQEDARISMRSLAEEVGVSTPTASNTVKELEELGVIQGYHTTLDTRRLGMHTFQIRLEVDIRSFEEAAEGIADMNEVQKLYELDGGTLFVEVIVPSLDVLDDVIRALRLIEGVEKLNVSRVTRSFKMSKKIALDSLSDLKIDCFYCKKSIAGTPVKLELDGKKHYVCCDVCASEYKEKYKRVKEKAEL